MFIIKYNDVDILRLYEECREKVPDKQVLIYCKTVLKLKKVPVIDWSNIIGMYKYYVRTQKQDEEYDLVKEVLNLLFGNGTVEKLSNELERRGWG